MTVELLRLKTAAVASPDGTQVELVSKSISFGYLVADGPGGVYASHIQGIDEDLIVRPFGRKGEFSTIRAVDLDAARFHMGMQPVEVVGQYFDDDRDGVVNELLPGEISALDIFLASMDRPRQKKLDREAQLGFGHFQDIGCAECHRPALQTESRYLGFSYPEVPADPQQNIFYRVDLSHAPSRLDKGDDGGIVVEPSRTTCGQSVGDHRLPKCPAKSTFTEQRCYPRRQVTFNYRLKAYLGGRCLMWKLRLATTVPGHDEYRGSSTIHRYNKANFILIMVSA
jgi:hypothetical protein